MHHIVPGSNLTTQSNFGTSIMPRYCCSDRHRSASTFHGWNRAFSIIDFLGRSPNINLTWCWEKYEGLHIWLYYMLPCIRCPGFVIIFGCLALFSVIRDVAIAALPWMVDSWSSLQIVSVETVFKIDIEFCCHPYCSSSMIFRHNPLQHTAIPFT